MTHYIGCHLSSNNIFKSIDQVNEYKGNFMQIFVTNPLGRAGSESLNKYKSIGSQVRSYCENNQTKIVVHCPYILNFAKEFNEDSNEIKRLLLELRIAHEIGAIGCVIHVGKRLDLDINDAVFNMYTAIKYVLNIMRQENLNTKLIL